MRIHRKLRRTRSSQDGSNVVSDDEIAPKRQQQQQQQLAVVPVPPTPKPLALRRTKSHDEVSHMMITKKIPLKKFGLRKNKRPNNTPSRGLGDNFLNDLDESNTSATMDTSSCVSNNNNNDGGHVRTRTATTAARGIIPMMPLLRRNKTFSGGDETRLQRPIRRRVASAEAPTPASSSMMTREQQSRHNRLKELPSTANYASCHILVNRERMRMNKTPLHRSRDLDAIARQRAQDMVKRAAAMAAEGGKDQQRLQIADGSLVENIQKGPSIHLIHQMVMSTDESRNILLSDQYTRFGVGCATDTTSNSGMIYMSQIFQAPKSNIWTQELLHNVQQQQKKKSTGSSSHLLTTTTPAATK